MSAQWEPVVEVAAAARRLGEVGWAEVPAADLPGVAVELARAKAQVEAALVAVAGRLAETDAAPGHGWASAKDFLTHLTGGRKGAGGGLVRAAAETAGLPGVRESFAAGRGLDGPGPGDRLTCERAAPRP